MADVEVQAAVRGTDRAARSVSTAKASAAAA